MMWVVGGFCGLLWVGLGFYQCLNVLKVSALSGLDWVGSVGLYWVFLYRVFFFWLLGFIETTTAGQRRRPAVASCRFDPTTR